jgi:hypothetical protein
MIDEYVNKLIENLPDDSKNLQRLDLVLDGGVFNGSYLIGALYFIKEMERRKYVKIERISGCSIGSVVAFLYLIDALDVMPKLYDIVKNDFKNNFSLNSIKTLKLYLQDRIPDDICSKVNGRLFICYNNIKNRKKVIKSNYKNVDEIIGTIIKSCYVPFLIDNNMLYKNKYIDGMNAYIFKREPNKKILHMELFGYDKVIYCLNIKNEKSNFHRILTGLLDIHSFYIKKCNTSMCSFVEDWNMINKCNYNAKLVFELIIINVFYFINYIKKYLPDDIKDNIFIKIGSKISFDIFSIIMDTYFL